MHVWEISAKLLGDSRRFTGFPCSSAFCVYLRSNTRTTNLFRLIPTLFLSLFIPLTVFFSFSLQSTIFQIPSFLCYESKIQKCIADDKMGSSDIICTMPLCTMPYALYFNDSQGPTGSAEEEIRSQRTLIFLHVTSTK